MIIAVAVAAAEGSAAVTNLEIFFSERGIIKFYFTTLHFPRSLLTPGSMNILLCLVLFYLLAL